VAGLPDHGVELDNPDFSALAQSIGIEAIRVEDPALLDTALATTFSHPGPALIDVVTDPTALSLPPKTMFKQVKGFALSMGRMVLGGQADEVLDTIRGNLRNL
jgi:thiamine pyrophosphate-dependent acetolactate synthase large subunit-like protein